VRAFLGGAGVDQNGDRNWQVCVSLKGEYLLQPSVFQNANVFLFEGRDETLVFIFGGKEDALELARGSVFAGPWQYAEPGRDPAPRRATTG
jgi:hypothetical protein